MRSLLITNWPVKRTAWTVPTANAGPNSFSKSWILSWKSKPKKNVWIAGFYFNARLNAWNAMTFPLFIYIYCFPSQKINKVNRWSQFCLYLYHITECEISCSFMDFNFDSILVFFFCCHCFFLHSRETILTILVVLLMTILMMTRRKRSSDRI